MIPGATLVTVVRHGQVNGRPFVYRGALDEDMTQHGLRQVRTVVVAQAVPAYDRIATSPLRRCRQFASAYAAETCVALQVMESMREMGFGDWEGLTPEQAAQRDPDTHARFRASAGDAAPPGGETVEQLRTRVAAGWDTWLRDSAGGHRLLLTHAGVMRALLMHLLGLPLAHAYRIALPEAAHFQVSVLPGDAPIVLNLNACAA
jgi:alpha-ribazole phosphatase